MVTTYDRNVDAVAIMESIGSSSARTVRITDDINFDFDKADKLVTIEILNASLYLPAEMLEALDGERGAGSQASHPLRVAGATEAPRRNPQHTSRRRK